MKIKIIMSSIFILLILSLSTMPAFGGSNKPRYLWKVATLAPKGVGWARQVAEIVEPAVTKSSDGNIVLKIFWGGVLGDDEAIITKMKKGKIQSAGLTALGAMLVAKEFAVLELPFLFRDYNEVDFIRKKMFPVFADFLEKNGFILYLWVDQDFDQLYSVKSLTKFKDFKNIRFASWHGPLEKRLIMSLEAVAVPTKIPDISASIRSGETTALIAPAIWMVGTQLYSTVRYVNPMKIRYSPAIIIVDKRAWDAIPRIYKERTAAMRNDLATRFTANTRKDNQKSLKAMIQYGLNIINMDSQSKILIESSTKDIWWEMAGHLYSKKLLNELTGNLEQYRKETENKKGINK